MTPLSRRGALMGATAALAGCSVLPSPKYVQRTTWSLALTPPPAARTRRGSKVLLVQEFNAAPGLDQQGVQWLNGNGSVHVDFYNLWEVQPARAVSDDARRWLAASGLFAAVVGAESGLPADLVLEGELTSLIANPALMRGHVAIGITLLDQHRAGTRPLLQRSLSAEGHMPTDDPAGVVAAEREAVAGVLTELVQVMKRFA